VPDRLEVGAALRAGFLGHSTILPSGERDAPGIDTLSAIGPDGLPRWPRSLRAPRP
jgi:hypothetical protein